MLVPVAPRRGARAEQRAGWAAFQEGRLERAQGRAEGAPRERGKRVRGGPGVSPEGAGVARLEPEAMLERFEDLPEMAARLVK